MSRPAPLRLSAAICASALLATLFAAGPASGASPGACRVKNLDTGTTRASLRKAHDLAKPGHRLTLRGTCKGTTTLGKRLTITGIRRAGSGAPTLDGNAADRVLIVPDGVKVTLRTLTVRRGLTLDDGGGIFNAGTLILRDVTVRGNSAAFIGGGIFNADLGTLQLLGSTTIRGNTSGAAGGGVLNLGTLRMKGSSTIRGNTGTGGGGVNNSGTLVMLGASSIRGNTSTSGGGGGVRNFGTLAGVTCGPAGKVRENTPDDCLSP